MNLRARSVAFAECYRAKLAEIKNQQTRIEGLDCKALRTFIMKKPNTDADPKLTNFHTTRLSNCLPACNSSWLAT